MEKGIYDFTPAEAPLRSAAVRAIKQKTGWRKLTCLLVADYLHSKRGGGLNFESIAELDYAALDKAEEAM